MEFSIDNIERGSTLRTQNLLKSLVNKGFSDRTGEWFTEGMLPAIGHETASIIERRAISFKTMLEAMVSNENSKRTHTYEIKSGELIVGVIPMGSVGFGKVYPQYLTDEEKRLITVTNRDMQSTFGHNVPSHERVLKKGLKWVKNYCEAEIIRQNDNLEKSNSTNPRKKKKLQFYCAVKTCCDAVIDYAGAFARLAEAYEEKETDVNKKAELAEIARICRKVPENPADSLHEAIQSIYFIHLALHSTLDYMSIGRLDQLLEPYLQQDLKKGIVSEERALELVECFLIKCAERMNSNPAYFVKYDHSSFGGVFGDNPVFLDQIASSNNFLQNIALGGLTRDGKDASNKSTLLILRACGNLGLHTPVVNMRMHKNTSSEVLKETVLALRRNRAGIPVIYNDESIIKAFRKNGFPIEECRDYAVDGCWEPILNAKCDWVFGMLNFLTILECSLNSGCTFSADKCLLKGNKISYRTKPPEEIKNFDELLENIRIHTLFFVDRAVLTAYSFYSVEGSVNPTPFFSSLLGGCLEAGMDKTWGGAEYHITGALAVGLPNCANALANIKKYVFEDKKYSLTQVVDALKLNFRGHDEMKSLFWKSHQKFGNNNAAADGIMKSLLDCFHNASLKARELGEKVFLTTPQENEETIYSHRVICHYEGPSMQEKYGDRFKMHYTLGCGTFGQYSLLGKSTGASADGRGRGEPLSPNFSPVSGTMGNGMANVVSSLKNLELERFAAGVVVDFCVDDTSKDTDNTYFENFIRDFVNKNGSIMTMTFIGVDALNNIYKICEEVRSGNLSAEALRPYSHVSVRVGGYNAPFISLPREQQLNYISRIVK